MDGDRVTIAADGGKMPVYMAAPTAAGRGPGVVMIPSFWGVEADVIGYADDLARRGCVVAVPDPFWRDETPGLIERVEGGRERAVARLKRVDRDRLVADIDTAFAYLKGLSECNGRSALVGFCFGGVYALLATTRLGADAGVAFHSGPISGLLGEAENVKATLSFHWGDRDHAAPPEELEKVSAAFARLPAAEVRIYPGAVHGYMHWTAKDVYHKDAAKASWARCVEILGRLR